jgi:DNA-binding GntR family transcriptional regulator
MIVRLDLAPGDVLRDDLLQEQLGIGRTPIREALQRLERDQFVTVIPRRGMFVASIDVSELSLLYETRAMMEPYAARLAARRGTAEHWDEMRDIIAGSDAVSADQALLDVDRRCHEITWAAAGNRFLTDTLDNLYAHSDRVWHMYLADVADTRHAVDEHAEILEALASGDAERSAALVEAHVRSFDDQVRVAVTSRLGPPLAG